MCLHTRGNTLCTHNEQVGSAEEINTQNWREDSTEPLSRPTCDKQTQSTTKIQTSSFSMIQGQLCDQRMVSLGELRLTWEGMERRRDERWTAAMTASRLEGCWHVID